MGRPFVHLHVHSHYSLLCGAIHFKSLFPRLKELEMDTIAITDRHQMFGAVDFQQKCQKNGIKPIFGTEVLYLPSRSSTEESYKEIVIPPSAYAYRVSALP